MRYLIAVLITLFVTSSSARDLGQWENSDPEVKKWYETLMRPDMPPNFSCCGEADAYWCDDISVSEGKTYCAITDDRDDAPLKRPHVPIGTKIFIPNEKLKWDRGNPTGHSIVFMHTSSSMVYCFVQNTGT